jgi:Mg2+/Co2+ transporter CorB
VPEKKIRKNEDGSYLIDGSASVRMLNRRLAIELPTTEATTLNGLILEHLESLPEGRTCLMIGPYELTIVGLSDNRIRRVQLKVLDRDEEA